MNTDLTDLTAIRQRAEAATKGKWQVAGRNRVIAPEVSWLVDRTPATVRVCETLRGMTAESNWDQAEADAFFIAHARTDIPYLLDRIEALERALVTARTALDAGFEPVMYRDECHWCRYLLRQHAPDCKRQQALTEIAGCLGAETAEVQP